MKLSGFKSICRCIVNCELMNTSAVCAPDLILRDPAPLLARTLSQARQRQARGESIWIFGYASLIWRPEFEHAQRQRVRVHGWHRALQMWSRINRGTPECPGLVFALLTGGSCEGVAYRLHANTLPETLERLWQREMPSGVYDPRWVRAQSAQGPLEALAFTLSRQSPNFCGVLSQAQYRQIFSESCGRYGSTKDYAQQTYDSLLGEGIEDRALGQLLKLAQPPDSARIR
jgi:glutathione-specific gamma-glutamylcyclotransferase